MDSPVFSVPKGNGPAKQFTSRDFESMTDEEKKDEFARLFYFFSKITIAQDEAQDAEYKMNSTSAKKVGEEVVPRDLAPLLKKLAAAHGKGTTSHDEEKVDTDSDGDEREQKKSSRHGKRYPFTFKMLLHTLYTLDDWAVKVNEVITESKAQYISMSDPEYGSVPSSPATPDSAFLFPNGSPTKKRFRDMSNVYSGAPAAPPPTPRGFKRRIVNRRRSIGENEEEDSAARARGWIYESAVDIENVDEGEWSDEGEPRRKKVIPFVLPRKIQSRKVHTQQRDQEGSVIPPDDKKVDVENEKVPVDERKQEGIKEIQTQLKQTPEERRGRQRERNFADRKFKVRDRMTSPMRTNMTRRAFV